MQQNEIPGLQIAKNLKINHFIKLNVFEPTSFKEKFNLVLLYLIHPILKKHRKII